MKVDFDIYGKRLPNGNDIIDFKSAENPNDLIVLSRQPSGVYVTSNVNRLTGGSVFEDFFLDIDSARDSLLDRKH